jgi:hypothetical protein
MNPTSLLQGGSSAALQNATPTQPIQGSSPQLQAANNSGLKVQNASPASTQILQPAGQSQVAANQSYINNATSQANNESATIANLLKSIQAEEQANAPGTAVSLNLNNLNAQAQNQAASTVNPLYTQYLNQYLQDQATNQQAAQVENTANIQNEQAALQNTLQQNQLQENAAASTNALQQGNINVQQQNYQLTSGNAQNQKLAALNQSIGQGGLGASGLGQQQVYQAENARNTADAAQAGQFQYQRDTSNLSAQDTFAQLAQSSQYANTQEGEAETATNFNLNDYLRQAAQNDQDYREALSTAQQQALTAQTGQNEAQLIQQQIAAQDAAGSKNYAASEQAYSNLLQPSLSLPTIPSESDYLSKADASSI